MTENELILLRVAEEACEIAHRVSKALNFGLDEIQLGQTLTNAQRVRQEYIDLQAVIMMAVSRKLLPDCSATLQEITAKRDKVLEYLEFSKKRGIIKDDKPTKSPLFTG